MFGYKNEGALQDILVLDFTQALSGPFCTMQLADLGANVIKVDRIKKVEKTGPFINGERTFDLMANRGKLGITLDLKDETDRKIALELAAKCDILVENFRPGVMERLGLDYESVRKVNPEIIYASISGFGQNGPYRTRGAYDTVIQGMSGLMSLTGEPDGPPYKTGNSICDMYAGLFCCIAVLGALHYRTVSGKGQYIDIGMLDCGFACLENTVLNYLHDGTVPHRIGNRSQHSAPSQLFPTKDGQIIIFCNTQEIFERFCDAVKVNYLRENPIFDDPTSRKQNAMALEKELIPVLTQYTTQELSEILDRFKVPYGVVNDVPAVCADPQIAARDMIVELDHAVAGKYRMQASPLKLKLTPPLDRKPGPAHGEHTALVFSELLGMSPEEIDAFYSRHGTERPKYAK